MITLTIKLNEDEQAAVNELAHQESTTVEGAALIAVRRELQRRGLLKNVEIVTEAGMRKSYVLIED